MGDCWHVEVDRSLCIGSAQCVHHAPDAFRLGTSRQSHPTAPAPDAHEKILEAAESLPGGGQRDHAAGERGDGVCAGGVRPSGGRVLPPGGNSAGDVP